MQCKTLTILILASLSALGCGGCSSFSPSAKDSKPQAPPDDTPRDGTGAQLGKPDFSLTAREYAEDVQKNYKSGANNPILAKYKGKVIEITGVAGHYAFRPPGTDRGGLVVFDQTAGKGPYVYCWTADPKPWNKATRGQTVKVKGNFVNDNLPMLENCVIEEVTGPSTLTVTPDGLTGEFAKDITAAAKKYKGKSLILTGEVDKVTEDRANGGRLTFKTQATGPRIECHLLTDYNPSVSSLKAGQTMKVIGNYSYADKEKVELHDCVLMK